MKKIQFKQVISTPRKRKRTFTAYSSCNSGNRHRRRQAAPRGANRRWAVAPMALGWRQWRWAVVQRCSRYDMGCSRTLCCLCSWILLTEFQVTTRISYIQLLLFS